MTTKTTIFLFAFAACLGSAASAEAQLNVSLGFNEPGYVVAQPAPVYERYPAYYDPHHDHHSDRYWAERRAHEHHEEHREHDERREEHRR